MIRQGADRIDVLNLLAHETFHNWVPHMADIYVDPDELGSEFRSEFFSVGFADYILKVILYENELVTKREIVSLINETLLAYAKNLANLVSFSEMQDVIERGDYNYIYEKVAYYREDLLAFKWDNRIRQATQGRETVLHLIKKFISKALESNVEIQFEDFFGLAEDYGIDEEIIFTVMADGAKENIQYLPSKEVEFQKIVLKN